MKNLYSTGFLLALFLSSLTLHAQLNNGGINAHFGVDGDTRSNYVKYGPVTGNIASDDWFSFTPGTLNVIDTSNASYYLSLLSGGANIAFSERMPVPLYSKVNGTLWLDAAYGRDYISTGPAFDSTLFTIAAKNGDDPSNWLGGVSNIPGKDDLIDVYAHMRRNGTTVQDSLWLFTGTTTVATTGSRYFDVELYKNNFAYDAPSGTFITAGPDAGHTQWLFNAAGQIIQTGDMILAVTYSPGAAPTVDVRIWVSQATFSSVIPARFNFGTVLDGATAAFGYVSIYSKSGATAFGSGIANYSTTAAQDTTYSTPWGTETGHGWGTQYQTLQLIEIGLNLTRIGLDPALYSTLGLNPCQSLFSDIFFKSRSSASFTSNMQDFVTPLTFLRPPLMDFGALGDTLSCRIPTGTLQITNNTTAGYYTWQVLNGGHISSSSPDSMHVSINKAGTYIVGGSPALGCPPTRYDTIVVPIDTFPPEATINAGIGSNYSYLQLYGGDTAASDYMTPFGRSQGLLWNWSGPNGFTSTIQNPRIDTAWGTYELIVTEKRNGCTDTAYKPLSITDFGVLASRALNLHGYYQDPSVILNWQDIGTDAVDHFEIERSSDGATFTAIGDVQSSASGDSLLYFYSYTDRSPLSGNNFYRLKIIGTNGSISYSTIVLIKADPTAGRIYLTNTGKGGYMMVCQSDKNQAGVIVVYDLLGQRLATANVQISQGTNTINVPVTSRSSITVVTLYLEGKLSFTQEMIP